MLSPDIKRFNTQHCRTFLYGVFKEIGYCTLVAIKPDSSSIHAESFMIPAKLREACNWAYSGNIRGWGMYYVVNHPARPLGRKPGKGDISDLVRFLHVDVDPDEERDSEYLNAVLAPQLVAAYLKPMAVVNSGHGLNVLYRTDAELPKSAAEIYNKGLAKMLKADENVFNCDRILRLPGSLNYPTKAKIERGYPEEPALSTLVHIDTSAVCPISNVIDAIGPHLFGGEEAASSVEADAAIQYGSVSPMEKSLYDLLLDDSEVFQRRASGSSVGLNGSSRSERDMSMMSIIKKTGAPFSYAVNKLCETPTSAGKERFDKNDMRYFYRMWNKVSKATTPTPTVTDPVTASTLPGVLEENFFELPKDLIDTKYMPKVAVPLPSDLHKPEGLVGYLMQDFLDTSGLDCPAYALASALAAVSATVGHRRIILGLRSTGTPLSTYMLTVGRAGAGKGYVISYLTGFVSRGDVLNKSVCLMDGRSERALKRGLSQVESGEPSNVGGILDGSKPVVATIDEFGLFLNAANSSSTSASSDILKGYLELYGRYNEGVVGLTVYASGSNIEPAKAPYFCINAAAETGSFLAALRGGNIHGGILSRFIYIDPGDERPKRKKIRELNLKTVEIIEKFISRRNRTLSRLLPTTIERSLSRNRKRMIRQGTHHDLLIMRPTPEALRLLFKSAGPDFWQEASPENSLEEHVLSAIFTRFGQHVAEIAGNIAAGCGSGMVIYARHVKFAIHFMTWSYGNLVHRLEEHLSSTEAHSLQNDITRTLGKIIQGSLRIPKSCRIPGAQKAVSQGVVPITLLRLLIRPERRYRLLGGSKAFTEAVDRLVDYGDIGSRKLCIKARNGKIHTYRVLFFQRGKVV